MCNDDLKMLQFAVSGGRYMWLMLIGLPLLPIVLWAARRAEATRSRWYRAGFVATAVVASMPFLAGAISFTIGMSKPFFGARAASRSAQCQSNLKELSRSVMLYAEDYDYTFPPADRWSDRVYSRTTLSSAWFVCPSSGAPYGYALNNAVAGVRMTEDTLPNPANTVLLFESDAIERNKAGSERDLTRIVRHPSGTFVAFVDGHVKRYRQSADSPILWDPKATFNPWRR